METSLRVLGAEHPSTLASMANLAWTLKDLGRNDEAVKLMGEVVQLSIKNLGVDHPDTTASVQALDEWKHG
jgi:hypothetical protein